MQAAASGVCMQDEYRNEPGAVIASDFYHSNALMALPDEAIVAKVQRNLEACEPGFIGAQARQPRTSLHICLKMLKTCVMCSCRFT